MKLEGTLPIPTLTATLGPAIGKAWRTVRIDGARKRGPGRGRGVRICTRCRSKGHQRNSRRGLAPMRNRTTGTWHTWKRRYVNGAPAHSKKPDESFALIEHASHSPFVELFSREDQPRLGWSYWGNQSLATAEIGAPA